MLAMMRNDIQSVFERDPAARSTLEVLVMLPRTAGSLGTPPGTLVLGARPEADRAGSLTNLPLDDRDRDPPRGEDRGAFLHRSRHGRGHR